MRNSHFHFRVHFLFNIDVDSHSNAPFKPPCYLHSLCMSLGNACPLFFVTPRARTLQMQESLHTASHLPGQELLRPPCETFIRRHARAAPFAHSHQVQMQESLHTASHLHFYFHSHFHFRVHFFFNIDFDSHSNTLFKPPCYLTLVVHELGQRVPLDLL